jgi:hypothetical protein
VDTYSPTFDADAALPVVASDAEGAQHVAPSWNRLNAVLAYMNQANWFVILRRLDDGDPVSTYIQCALNDDRSWVVEHRDGGPHAHYTVDVPTGPPGEVNPVVMDLLTRWALDRPGWRDALSWERVPF